MSIQFQIVPASESGIIGGRSHGGAWGDFNGDGYPDLWVNRHLSPGSLYLNQKDGTFTDVTTDIFVEQPTGDHHGAAWADFDNDGDQDLVQLVGGGRGTGVGPAFSNQFYVNEAGQLEDRAASVGIDYPAARGRAPLLLDVNNDGLLDVVVGVIPRQDEIEAPPKIFQQNADGTFEDVSAIVGFELDNAPSFFLSDLSGDGNLDVVADTGRPFTVYDATSVPWVDITSDTLPNSTEDGGVASADFNGDLLPDLFITRSRFGRNDIYQNDIDRATARLGATRNEKGFQLDTDAEVTFDILTTDGRFSIDLNEVYIGAEGINPTDWEFTLSPDNPDVVGISPHTPGVDRGIYIGYDPTLERWQFLLSSADETNLEQNILDKNNLIAFIETSDAISELTGIGFQADPPPPDEQLLLNTTQGLIDRSEEAGINSIPGNGRSVVAGDFDNDMDQDVYIVTSRSVVNTPNVLYENQGDGTFIAVPDAGGAAGTELGQGEFVMTADYDLDGFLDLLVANGGGPPTPLTTNAPYELFRNQGNSNHWLELDLQGTVSNRDGIGAQVFLTAGGVTQLREQSGGINHSIQNHQRLHFGLAEHTEVQELTIHWPSGRVQRIENLPADRLFQIVEIGGNTSDRIIGTSKNEVISGGQGYDFLNGKQGNDFLYGDNGKDRLIGGPGQDVLTGGRGDDFFFLQKNKGADTITDFQDGTDSLKLTGGITFEQLSIEQVNSDTQISMADSDRVLATLLGIDASVIGAEDFLPAFF